MAFMRPSVKFAAVIAAVLIATSGCGKIKSWVDEQESFVERSGEAVHGDLDKVIDAANRHNGDLEREMK